MNEWLELWNSGLNVLFGGACALAGMKLYWWVQDRRERRGRR